MSEREVDFPIPWAGEDRVTRRAFTRSLAGFSCAALAGTRALARRAQPPAALPAVHVAAAADLAVGQARVFAYPDEASRCILIRLDAGTFAAFAQECTHLACPVTYQAPSGTLHCPCHEGSFSARDGSVLAGPPPRPLPRIVLERRGEELWAVGVRP
jgi:Rieske Fe-S protein